MHSAKVFGFCLAAHLHISPEFEENPAWGKRFVGTPGLHNGNARGAFWLCIDLVLTKANMHYSRAAVITLNNPTANDCISTFYVYPLRFDADIAGVNRNEFINAVNAEGILFYQGYSKPLYLQPLYQKKHLFK